MGLDDAVPDGVKVFQPFLELTGSECYEFGGGHCRLWWYYVSVEIKAIYHIHFTFIFTLILLT
jgi:hypothetical protein